MFDSLGKVAKDVTRIATAPVEVAVDTARVVTKPLADVSQEIVDGVKSETREDGVGGANLYSRR